MTYEMSILNEREKTHGPFSYNAQKSQEIKDLFKKSAYWDDFRPEHKEALDMIALKLSRILSGQADYFDHWKDISGYASLAEEACPKKDTNS